MYVHGGFIGRRLSGDCQGPGSGCQDSVQEACSLPNRGESCHLWSVKLSVEVQKSFLFSALTQNKDLCWSSETGSRCCLQSSKRRLASALLPHHSLACRMSMYAER